MRSFLKAVVSLIVPTLLSADGSLLSPSDFSQQALSEPVAYTIHYLLNNTGNAGVFISARGDEASRQKSRFTHQERLVLRQLSHAQFLSIVGAIATFNSDLSNLLTVELNEISGKSRFAMLGTRGILKASSHYKKNQNRTSLRSPTAEEAVSTINHELGKKDRNDPKDLVVSSFPRNRADLEWLNNYGLRRAGVIENLRPNLVIVLDGNATLEQMKVYSLEAQHAVDDRSFTREFDLFKFLRSEWIRLSKTSNQVIHLPVLTGTLPSGQKAMREELVHRLLAGLLSVRLPPELSLDRFDIEAEVHFALSEGDLRGAIQLLESFLRDHPDTGLRLRLASAYLAAHQFRDAAIAAMEVLKKDPKNAKALALSGRANSEMKRFGEAVGFSQREVAAEPNNRIARRRLIANLRSWGRESEASVLERDASLHNPDAAETKLDVVRGLLHRGPLPMALAICGDLLADQNLTPLQQGETYDLLSSIQTNLGRHGEALEAAKRAVEKEPGYDRYQHALAKAYMRNDQRALAEQSVRAAVRLSPTNFWFYLTWIDILLEQSKTEAAQLVAEAVFQQINPRSKLARDIHRHLANAA